MESKRPRLKEVGKEYIAGGQTKRYYRGIKEVWKDDWTSPTGGDVHYKIGRPHTPTPTYLKLNTDVEVHIQLIHLALQSSQMIEAGRHKHTVVSPSVLCSLSGIIA